MTDVQFSRLAMSLPETKASEHMGHPDFRVAGKIFATLGWPDAGCGMVKLTPAQQTVYTRSHPKIFSVIDNGWGRRGATTVHLKAATMKKLMPAMIDAWKNNAPKKILALIGT